MITQENYNYLMNVVVSRSVGIEKALNQVSAELIAVRKRNTELELMVADKKDSDKAAGRKHVNLVETPKQEDTDEDTSQV